MSIQTSSFIAGHKSDHTGTFTPKIIKLTENTVKQGQPVVWWLNYMTGTREVSGSSPGVATIRSLQLLGP